MAFGRVFRCRGLKSTFVKTLTGENTADCILSYLRLQLKEICCSTTSRSFYFKLSCKGRCKEKFFTMKSIK